MCSFVLNTEVICILTQKYEVEGTWKAGFIDGWWGVVIDREWPADVSSHRSCNAPPSIVGKEHTRSRTSALSQKR